MISIVSGILTSFLGWAGGRGDDFWKDHPRWPRWLLQGWVRDWVIGPVCALTALLLGIPAPWWILALLILTTKGGLCTYWDRLFGYDNFYFHGFVIGLAAFPLAIVTGRWLPLLARTIFLTLWMGLWSGAFKNPHVEDLGRYAAIGSTIFMLC